MAPQSTLATLFALSASVAAQSSLLTLPFFGYDDQTIVASVVQVQSSITTLQLACPDGEDQNDCGLFPYQTLTVGSSTYNMEMSDADFTATQMCEANTAVTAVVCMESASGASANDPGSSTTTYNPTDVAVLTVTVTAGASKLAAGAAVATGPASTGASVTGSSSGVTLVTGTGGSAATSMKTTGSAKSSSSGSAAAATTGTGTTTNGAMATVVPAVFAAGVGLMGWLL